MVGSSVQTGKERTALKDARNNGTCGTDAVIN